MCVYIYIHIYICTYIHIDIHVYTCIHLQIFTYIHVCIHTQSPKASANTPSSQKHTRTRSVPYCPHNHTHCVLLLPHVKILLAAIRIVRTIYVYTHVGSNARKHEVVWDTHTHTQNTRNNMAAHMHSLNIQRLASASRRTSSAMLAASGVACSSAATSSGPAWFFAA